MKRRRSTCRSAGTGTDDEAAANQVVRVTPALVAAAKPRRAEFLREIVTCLMTMRQVGIRHRPHSLDPLLHHVA